MLTCVSHQVKNQEITDQTKHVLALNSHCSLYTTVYLKKKNCFIFCGVCVCVCVCVYNFKVTVCVHSVSLLHCRSDIKMMGQLQMLFISFP